MANKTITTSVNPANSGTVSGGGTYAENTLVTVTANKKFGYKFKDWLLKGYTQLEYIQSSGTQYIDTLYKWTSNKAKIEAKFNLTSSNGGVYGTQSGTIHGLTLFKLVNYYRFIGADIYQNSSITTSLDYTISQEYYNGSMNISVNGTQYSVSGGSNLSNQYNTYIFSSCYNGSTDGYTSAKLYEFKMYDNDVLVRDFIPVIRHSDGAIGLLDKVNMKFYGNSGSGEFIGGNPV